ncbi:MAG: hypothetical protein IPP67_09725 [Rhodospirillaceae bacterium]|nr:hypothetical protein [Rhodospirillaceae bacterium]
MFSDIAQNPASSVNFAVFTANANGIVITADAVSEDKRLSAACGIMLYSVILPNQTVHPSDHNRSIGLLASLSKLEKAPNDQKLLEH